METKYKRFIVVGGNPFTGYTGTTTYTSLKIIGYVDSKEELKKLVEDSYEECGGLMHVIDLAQQNESDIPFQGS